MIIQKGMRTDIPAFYPEWLINRINLDHGLRETLLPRGKYIDFDRKEE